jgi:hypothetical protein
MRKQKESMRKHQIAASLAAVGLCASMVTHAAPVELFQGELTKIKFTNFEAIFDANSNSILDAGDKVFGVLQVTSIENFASSANKNAQLANIEVTGVFQFTITGPGTLPAFAAGTGHLDFEMNANPGPLNGNPAFPAGDFLQVYYDDKNNASGSDTSNPFNPATIASGLASSSDGNLLFQIDPSVFYEGQNTTVLGQSFNRNYANLSVNNTGYTIDKLPYGTAAGEPEPHILGDGTLHGAHVVDTFFASRVFVNNITGIAWPFRSEDPLYIQAAPEPGVLALLGLGLLGVGVARRRKQVA